MEARKQISNGTFKPPVMDPRVQVRKNKTGYTGVTAYDGKFEATGNRRGITAILMSTFT